MSYQPTTDDLQVILRTMKRAHLAAGPADAALRKDRLLRAARLIRENHTAISVAISADFGNRSVYQSMIADMATTVNMLEDSAEHVSQWMKPEVVENPATGMQAWIEQQPLGVVGIISPWNFPINLAFGPLAGVFAAGNTAMIKPSELTPKTSELLAELIAGYFDPIELTVVLGDASVGAAFSGLPFDHLVFTGSTSVGRHVMRAAAENLVPVTLELGGKSPVVVAEDFDMCTAVERTLTIKTFNAGQICLSPDYMMVPHGALEQLVRRSKEFIAASFASLISNDEYTSIISERHFERLVGLLSDAEQKGATLINLAPGSEPAFDSASRKIAPHLLLDVTDDMAIMQEEIFGPLLPVKTYRNAEEPIAYINANPRPLAAYYFGNNPDLQAQFTHQTTSGGLVINDVMTHASIDSLPFGGVGASGMGAYHGIHGFRRFTHAKPVVVQSQDGASNLRLRAPYADKAQTLEAFFNS
ncbi:MULTISPECIES: coniferyl aldehyde dehydrogenase [unclassified Pseudomonas]|uniref:coniferyl aldehyde dehydrogenase n=1 Tax=unclassified Pseudomonas TaxID=196821 RepID=UPI002AC952F3|nr:MULTISPECIES: coniferyl aldehyde dehydrogenase [unclassified Pseudomonas]MEB0047540.1 coniferyl aldehyde dehydrogenase [Pseudomonas sp. Dout3]MEB0097983.1 coniferyl aldehyde dehydrogenase [Pseudomonas sp. DC1.2]WPX57010.1 coniferyl aldehyde dehydrogenase [Pseudomonas sp. DC1.2]